MKDVLKGFYEVLLDRGLTASQSAFSVDWCEMSPNYLSRRDRAGTDTRALVALARNLTRSGHADIAVTVVAATFGNRGRE